ncbi:hypothetical protein GcC1_105022 [Golovinomyces cichoracearum]|uniref:Uncharacterized protein n=1 Tax=Golovinomyces cichoracearum TaxID=62708 RepID=A0A420I9F0_9PEZI|nr:hypothetical protein GcC1_105022 [Golovinomyces cichoracearum]
METVRTKYLLVEAGEDDDHEELIAITYEQAKKGAILGQCIKSIRKDQIKDQDKLDSKTA